MIHLIDKKLESVISKIPDDWKVLDIGGWAKPFPRANVVIDIQPYDTRQTDHHAQECFSEDSWIIMDIGGSTDYQLPFLGKSFEFIWCQQTLEDLGNPFKLMREMQRVGQAGFIEVPSRQWEHTVGVDSPDFAGFCHHRWCCELEPDGDDYIFSLTMKSPYIAQYGACELPEKRRLGFIWTDNFKFRECLFLTKQEIIQDVIDFKNIRKQNQVGVY